MLNAATSGKTRVSRADDLGNQISQTRTIQDLVQDAGSLRTQTKLLSQDVAETQRQIGALHQWAFSAQLEQKARDAARQSVGEMLSALAGEGFAWRDIARLIGVSVPAVRRWRQGESLTGEHRLAIGRLIALVEILRADHLIKEVASWLEIPLNAQVPLTGIDLAAEGRYEDVLELAANHVSSDEVLDRWQPDWRTRYLSEFEVFEAPDGDLGIRRSGASYS